ncbi:MAG: flagellar hook-length control protein FliK, partial [Campylobacterota bacterium]|nr:flagellar hook-length control protein FliK [Campylobacterota bacterium]
MINLSTGKQLGIILPNTNKALAEVLNNISPKELEVISQGKDLKTVMSSLLQQSSQNPKSDQVLLELLKNNPTLKSLGNVTDTVKELLNTLKSDKNPLPVEKVLKNFLIDMKQLSEPLLKEKLSNSGVFLESKIKNVQNPQVELKNSLEAIVKILDQSSIPAVKAVAAPIKELLSSKVLQDVNNMTLTQTVKNETAPLQQLSKSIEAVVAKLQIFLKDADPISSKNITVQLSKLEHLIEPKMLKSENFQLAPLQESLQQLASSLAQSKQFEAKGLFNILDKVIQVLQVIQQSSNTPKAALQQIFENNIPQSIRSVVEPLKVVIEKIDPIFSKESTVLINKLSSLSTPEKLMTQHNVKEILANDLKSVLLQAGDEIAKSNHPNQTELLKHIDKLSLQIDYHQMMSHLSNASSLYLPFSWDMLEEGNITLQHSKENKFYCDIELKLKEYGELNLRLELYDKNQLNLHVYSKSDDLKTLIKENIPLLRSALIDSEITPREIRIFNEKP